LYSCFRLRLGALAASVVGAGDAASGEVVSSDGPEVGGVTVATVVGNGGVQQVGGVVVQCASTYSFLGGT
jgi:hypothetical protein